MKYLFSILGLLFAFTIQAQNSTFGPGEKLVYTASYNMSGLMTDLAQVTMETSEVKTSKSTLYKLKCKAQTYSKWNSFFKIDDFYESYVSPTTIKPYLYKRDINEGGYKKIVQYKYKRRSGTVNSTITKWRADGKTYDQKKTLNIGSNSRDIVSTIYNLRNLDIDKAAIGATDSFTLLFDNQEKKISFSLIGKETIKTAIGDKECYKIAISLSGSSFLKGKNNNVIWLTADKNKIPVYAKFKVPVGNGELKIKSATGLKN